ncbi:hypothetical protein GXP70_07960 [Paenibacillus lycopersici]|uniref:Uncharacterized protein n=1 Tax=Paenibacillus lycopersici TaxID=2704462 RepID=A0A6C0FWP0_9BACL|nr:DUF6155 family protein [Paenibacillus lycopersici]QHT59891.1 hypothetical protein GXP70_07960 [Paenibacillus lycopersici]
MVELKRFLKDSSHAEIVAMVMECYKLNEEVRKYFQIKLNPEDSVIEFYEDAKKAIIHEFYPDKGEPKLRLSQAKQAISNFNKLCNDISKSIDLMLLYVEQGIEFTNDCGDINERFYDSMISMYGQVIKKIRDNHELNLYGVFEERLRTAVEDAEGTGWGFYECLADLFYELEREYADDECFVSIQKSRRITPNSRFGPIRPSVRQGVRSGFGEVFSGARKRSQPDTPAPPNRIAAGSS